MRLLHLPLLFAASLAAQTPLQVEGLSAKAPLAIKASATAELLVVEMSLKPEWHVYSRDVGGGQPVVVRTTAGSALVAAGDQKLPAGVDGKLHGNVRVELPLKRAADGGELRAVVDFMICDPIMCLPPMTVTLTGEVAAAAVDGMSVLLVVDEKDGRSERVEAFLKERGFEVGTTTYAEARPDYIAGYEVVLADSKRFGKTAKNVRQQVLKFPKTKTPMIAVGFFGTELIEGHQIAMTSGYI